MSHIEQPVIRRSVTMFALVGFTAVAAMNSPTLQAAIQINPASINMFRDSRGVNDLGIAPGERMQYGANVLGGSAGTFLGATYPPTGFVDASGPCAPVSTNLNFCNNSVTYNPARTAAPWEFTFTRPGETALTVPGPSLMGTDFRVPQPTGVTISGSGRTPTISWTLPTTPAPYVPDGFRIQIYDKSTIRVNGVADIIHGAAVSETATSYTLPSILSTNRELRVGGHYSINFQVIETRGDIAFTGGNQQILSRSQSYFSFTPLDNTAPPVVFLPELGPDVNPGDNRGAPYQFSITEVGPDSVTFIDPIVAIGYDYAIGENDPNFASVVLPTIGDGQFELHFEGENGPEVRIIDAGDQFFFQTGGVSAFTVLGIEASAGLDPANVTAFVTGLTFVNAGAFTGTMTPITLLVPIPEPETYALMLFGLGIVGFAARRRAGMAPNRR